MKFCSHIITDKTFAEHEDWISRSYQEIAGRRGWSVEETKLRYIIKVVPKTWQLKVIPFDEEEEA